MKNLVKKITAAVLTAGIAVSLIACGGSKKQITIAVPNDTTNEARALLLLEDLGYITLKDDVGITATIQDIKDNPKNIKFN